jgi:hypothetical protein
MNEKVRPSVSSLCGLTRSVRRLAIIQRTDGAIKRVSLYGTSNKSW